MSVKITPRIRKITESVEYDDLKLGDFFLSGDSLNMKCDGFDQCAVCIQTGIVNIEMCNYDCIPVDVEIKWTKSKPKDKKGK